MPKIRNREFETFNDGIMNIYDGKERRKGKKKFSNIRFGNKVIGNKKYYEAKVLNEKLEKAVVIPPINVSQTDYVEIGLETYAISSMQYKFDAQPPHILLNLVKGGVKIGSR